MRHMEQDYQAALEKASHHFNLIKKRIWSLHSTVEQLSNSEVSLDYSITLDHAYLDIRKIIEELMLISVAAHDHAGIQLTKRIRKEWNAQKIMRGLEQINSKFFPDAIEILPSDEDGLGGKLMAVDTDYLARDFAAEMYNLCGDVLHSNNKPISPNIVQQRFQKAKKFELEVRRLLDTFEIDISGNGFMVFGHLEFEKNNPPKLFLASLVH